MELSYLRTERMFKNKEDFNNFKQYQFIVENNFPDLSHNEVIINVLRFAFGYSIRQVALKCGISTRQVLKNIRSLKEYDFRYGILKVKHPAKHLND